MGLEVFTEMITAHETFPAAGACKTFLPCVRSQVTLQLIGTREAFATEQPRADERSLPRMPSEVSFQMRRLAVHLSASGHVTDVLFPLPAAPW